MSARGLFRATGATAKPKVIRDQITNEIIKVDAVPREKDDFYPTPPEPIRALLAAEIDRLRDFLVVWENACGDGAMVREMESVGLEVYQSDMIDRNCGAEIKSLYEYTTAPSPCSITNPPFQECNSGEWIMHSLETLDLEYMALLLPLGWPGAVCRAGLWSKHPPARVYLMRWRIDFTGEGAPPMLNAWFVWDKKWAGETAFRMLDKGDDLRQGEMF